LSKAAKLLIRIAFSRFCYSEFVYDNSSVYFTYIFMLLYSLEQCFSTPSPRTHLSPLKALDESAEGSGWVRGRLWGKHVCCNIPTQQ